MFFASEKINLLGITAAFLCSFTAALAVTNKDSPQGDNIQVYDNVLPEPAQDILHAAASASGHGHKLFTRPVSSSGESPVIERALDTILSQLGDVADEENRQYVEYWTRQEWRHIEAHSDVDEHLAKEHDAMIANGDLDSDHVGYRYPKNGHVLYLKIGNKVRGPTCVFPDLQSGGDLVKGGSNLINHIDVVTVPAVNGRLLRFNGDSLHAVPRPADLWFLSFVRGAPEFTPEEEWGRSVVLFNTWTDNAPKDVPLQNKNPENDGQDLVNDASVWTKAFPASGDAVVCSAGSNGEGESKNDNTMSKVKIWLLGNERRRNCQMRTVKMAAKSSVKDAFLETSTVSLITLQ